MLEEIRNFDIESDINFSKYINFCYDQIVHNNTIFQMVIEKGESFKDIDNDIFGDDNV